jgi:hypothetical protein
MIGKLQRVPYARSGSTSVMVQRQMENRPIPLSDCQKRHP